MRRCERVRVGVHMRVCLRMPVGTCESRRFLQPLPSPPPPANHTYAACISAYPHPPTRNPSLRSFRRGAIGSGALRLRCCRPRPRPFRAACWPPPASWERERVTEERGRGEGAKERQTRSHAPTDLCILLNMVPSGVAHCCCDAAVSIRTLSEQRVGRRQHHGLVVVLGIGQPENRSAHPHIHRAEARLEGRERDL